MPLRSRSPHAFGTGTRCVEAAIQAVRTAEVLESRNSLNEAHAFTIDVLAMAAITLLVVELGAPAYATADMVRKASKRAKTLLESLAKNNWAASQCLESLAVSKAQRLRVSWSEVNVLVHANGHFQPLHQCVMRRAPPVQKPAEQNTPETSLSVTKASNVQVFNSQLHSLESSDVLGQARNQSANPFNTSTLWPDLPDMDNGVYTFSNFDSFHWK